LIAALHIFELHLSPPSSSPLAPVEPANPDSPVEWPLKPRERERGKSKIKNRHYGTQVILLWKTGIKQRKRSQFVLDM